MKSTLISTLFLVLVVSSYAVELSFQSPVIPESNFLCPMCIQEALALVNVLLNGILGKTVQTCNELCSYASSPFEQRICDYACDAIGLATFIKLLEEDGKDIDLIYLCELVKICPMEACTGKCMEIQSFKVNPNPVVIGSDINNIITVQEFKAWNGTGMFRYELSGPGDFHVRNDQVLQGGFPVGSPVNVGFKFPTKTQQGSNQRPFEPGMYQAQVILCDGTCGSTFPDSRTLAQATTTFSMVQPNAVDEDEILVSTEKRGFLKKLGKGLKKVSGGSKCSVCKTAVTVVKNTYGGQLSRIPSILNQACGNIPVASDLCRAYVSPKAQQIGNLLNGGSGVSAVCSAIGAC